VTPRFFPGAAAFRRWLDAHHVSKRELIVGFYKKHTGKPSLTYQEAVDEALCAGWIDGVRRTLDGERYTIRFTPRRPRSRWSRVNIRRAGELAAEGRMTPTGLAVFAARRRTTRGYSYETRPRQFPLPLKRRFRANASAWAFFESEPPGYRRTAIWWVVSAKKPETRARRLERVIECSARGARLPELQGRARTAAAPRAR
jgi:uncharacterized protein YdeI (YjbR/CyaY-like superfamily)